MKKPDLSFESLEPFFDKIEKLSQLHRILISSGIFLLVIGLFVWLLYVPKYKTIGKLETDLEKLQNQLRKAKADARDLKKFQERMKKAEARFRLAKKSLPEKEEIPSLLSSISQSGQDSGLEFLLFQPRGERKKNFYAEIPVNIKVNGQYHNVALFFDKVARLPRVVNIQNIEMKPIKGGQSLTTTCTAVTYKFIEQAPKKKKKKTSSKKK
jgi:type IV pilus assembly protein PilO